MLWWLALLVLLEAVGMLPLVVYIRVVPGGISTLTVSVPLRIWLPSLTTGGSSLLSAKTEVAFVLPGVGLSVQPHVLPPSVVRAQAVRLMALGYCSLVMSSP